MSERTDAFVPVSASGVRPPAGVEVGPEALVLGPWIARRRAITGVGGALLSRRGNVLAPTLILTRRRRLP